MMYKSLTSLALCVLLSACSSSAPEQAEQSPQADKPKNIIYLIGDGMGIAATTSYRYYKNRNSEVIEPTIFDNLLVGTASTYPHDDTIVTDSAAAGTALASGYKTYNRAIGVTPEKQPLDSLIKLAKERNYTTGVVVTSQINHATPASFYAHDEDRGNYDAIADDFIDNQHLGRPLVDVALGGGQNYFKRDDRNILSELTQQGYSVSTELSKLDELQKLPAIGLFAPVGLPYAIDSVPAEKERLAQMTEKALSLLAKEEKPFVLMIEGSQIDWCEHANDIACLMAEMNDFEKTLELVYDFAAKQGDTLIVVTADHATGGLSVGGHHKKEWKPEVVAQVHASIQRLVQVIMTAPKNKIGQVWQQSVEFELSGEELWQLQQVHELKLGEEEKKDRLAAVLRMILNPRSYTGWTTLSHSADDVPVLAFGPGAEQFIGYQDNSEIGKKLISLLR